MEGFQPVVRELMGMQPARALVVEDQPVSATWLADALREAFPAITVDMADSVTSSRAQIALCKPDLALVDLGLPDGSGIEVIQHLSKVAPQCTCVVSTIFADDRHVFPALRAGASGYLLKDQRRSQVIAALHGIAAGEPPLSPVIARRLLRVFSSDQKPAAETSRLSPRETETLALIAKGCKLPELATRLGVTKNTAAEYIKGIYHKLQISSRAEAAIEATRMGLINPHM